MKFSPILFSTPMVQAILNGTKTQTRRVVKPQPEEYSYGLAFKGNGCKLSTGFLKWAGKETPWTDSPYGQVGDVLWVRETWNKHVDQYYYKADFEEAINFRCKPSIHMPKEACRLFLKITDIRVERLQDISEVDSIDEGVMIFNEKWIHEHFPEYAKKYHLWEPERHGNRPPLGPSPKMKFQKLWQSINGEESWNSNPWVWVISFKRIDKPENFY